MSFRFFKRLKIAPGVTLNLAKRGGSVSFGPRGGKLTVGGSRGTRLTAGIPGTGLYYTQTTGSGRGRSAPDSASSISAPEPHLPPEQRLSMGFFRRLITPAQEEALVDGMRELSLGNLRGALGHLQNATHVADGAFLAGLTALNLGDMKQAATDLKIAATDHEHLGRHFDKYGVSPAVSILITPEITAAVEPCLRGVLLALVEVHQRLGETEQAMACLKRLIRLEPADVMSRLSLCELMFDTAPGDPAACRGIIELAEGIENDSAVHAALLLYKAKALHKLGLTQAARNLLTASLRRKKDRPQELLLALRYERTLVYESMGNAGRARSELERIYAQSPGYEDVDRKLGLGKS